MASQVYANIDIARFSSLYAARGRWALLDWLACTNQLIPEREIECGIPLTNRVVEASPSTLLISLEAVYVGVRTAVETIFGQDALGALSTTVLGRRCLPYKGKQGLKSSWSIQVLCHVIQVAVSK